MQGIEVKKAAGLVTGDRLYVKHRFEEVGMVTRRGAGMSVDVANETLYYDRAEEERVVVLGDGAGASVGNDGEARGAIAELSAKTDAALAQLRAHVDEAVTLFGKRDGSEELYATKADLDETRTELNRIAEALEALRSGGEADLAVGQQELAPEKEEKPTKAAASRTKKK